MKKLIPIIMLLTGAGAGVGAGVFLRPEHVPSTEEELANQEAEMTKPDAERVSAGEEVSSIQGMQYIKLANQFVVPIVKGDRVASMVVLTLSVEVPEGQGQSVYDMEPKIRDEFLRVLFDYATIGGFDGAFLNNGNLDIVRRNLREIAHKTFGKETINDVLIFEIARQDY